MSSNRVSHNKKRNVGLVYELLSREASLALIEGDHHRGKMIVDVLSKHLSEGMILHEELVIHQEIMESRGVNERMARRLVDAVKIAGIKRSSMRRLVEQAKTEMIHDINRRIGPQVFDQHRISDYTAHASVGIILSRGMTGAISEGIDMVKIEEHLTSFLMSSPGSTKPLDKSASLLAYKTALGLFESEYGKLLDDDQSELLREYVKVSMGGNIQPFVRTFEKQKKLIESQILKERNDQVFKEDSEMLSKLDEAVDSLRVLEAQPDVDTVERLMMFHELLREIRS